MLLAEDVDIPAWCITNDWHKLIGIAYSGGDSSGGGGVCDPDPDGDPDTDDSECLTLTGGGFRNYNKRALVVSAGEQLAAQDRTSGSANDYYENENAVAGDDEYEIGDRTGAFNDQTRVLDTSP